MAIIEKIIKVNDNKELHTVLNYVVDEPIFFDDEKRLLSKDEITNYKEELLINADIVPLIDLGDNSFIVYNPNKKIFQMYDISQDIAFKDLSSIEKYIELIDDYCKDELENLIKQNNAEEIFKLGNRYYHLPYSDRAVLYYKKAEELGFEKAKYGIARCYYNGIGVNKDYEKAYKLFSEIMEDDIEAKYYIGLMYYNGRYVNQDYEKAYNILNELADKNDFYAKKIIAEMYYFGRYVEKDYTKAFELYKSLYEERKDDYSLAILTECYYFGRGTEKDYKIAREYGELYEQKNNDVYVEYYLGEIYFLGKQTEKDYKKAKNYFEKAIVDDADISYYYLGLIYQSGGYGIEKDELKAKEYFYKIETDLCNSIVYYIFALFGEENFEERMLEVLNTKRDILASALTSFPKGHPFIKYFQKLQSLNNETYLDIVNRLKVKVQKFKEQVKRYNFIEAIGSEETVDVFSGIIIYSSEYNSLNEYINDMINKDNRRIVDFINRLEVIESSNITKDVQEENKKAENLAENHWVDKPDYDLDKLNVFYERSSHADEMDRRDNY